MIHLRTLLRVGIERVADSAPPGAGAAFFHELVVDFLFHEHPRSGAAALAVIEEQSEVRALHGFIEIGIREHDIRALTAQFQRDPLQVGLRRGLHDQMSHFG